MLLPAAAGLAFQVPQESPLSHKTGNDEDAEMSCGGQGMQ